MLGLGSREIIIIAFILVLLFGAKKIPELAKAISESIKNLKEGFKDVQENEQVDGGSATSSKKK
jgi:sec-independent protein translocase protein TatA